MYVLTSIQIPMPKINFHSSEVWRHYVLHFWGPCWRQQGHPKRRYPTTTPHGVTTQRNSNLHRCEIKYRNFHKIWYKIIGAIITQISEIILRRVSEKSRHFKLEKTWIKPLVINVTQGDAEKITEEAGTHNNETKETLGENRDAGTGSKLPNWWRQMGISLRGLRTSSVSIQAGRTAGVQFPVDAGISSSLPPPRRFFPRR
jgi:hypothetical protein